ncbi:hypothetical protein AALP_AA5G021800 [Arabis alpina]|uniref:Uncharacterized protein n=1 Tax=Arabis alpina TaxID=50452 RepID=A0A087GUF5_ARAAL|nr:hypothetical protein AALP_AA5G021800 [Arabis alpina]
MSSTKTLSSPHALMTTPPPVNLWLILSESKRIINSHSRHFLALSVLFLLPLFFSPTVFHIIINQSAASLNSVILLHDGVQPPRVDHNTKMLVLIRVRYMVLVTVFNLLAIGSITYSVFQGFSGRPVNLISSVKSSFTSFFPLLATLISRRFIAFGIFLILGFAVSLLAMLIEINETDFLPLSVIVVMTISVLVILIKLNIDWILDVVIVIVESQFWGLKPLKRSKSLIKGMRRVSLSIIFFFAVTEVTLGYMSRACARIYNNNGNGETNVFFVVRIVITSAFQTLLTLYNIAAITVMYMYCKAREIAQESAREYVSLPFDDDGKVYNNFRDQYPSFRSDCSDHLGCSRDQVPGWISSLAASSAQKTTIAFFVLQIVIVSAFLMFISLYRLAATTVMYIYCKDSHDEVGSERKYVSLPFDDDDGKLLHSAYNNV